ncbi:hypothetical protein ACFFGV_18165 [Pontibacillus salicampi]|uniref:Uncharacterized protein n=1 Tax=Pontibacillus salicampi TaxID=1449801 RepID=A0ABV6LTD8_9BACI
MHFSSRVQKAKKCASLTDFTTSPEKESASIDNQRRKEFPSRFIIS